VSSLGDRFRVVQTAESGEIADSVFHAAVHDRGLTRIRVDGWPTTERSLEALGDALLVQTSEGRSGGVWERDGAVVRVGLMGGWLHVQGAAGEQAVVERAIAGLRLLFPMPDPSSSHEVPVTFWTYTPHGPMPSVRTIAVPEWDEIAANYAARTREKLDAIMSGFRPAHGGQLVLWHGRAGTGKTFALRALAWEWRDWCQLHYVVDPDSFFGQHADYLMGVLMQPGVPMIALRGGMVGRAMMLGGEFEDLDEDGEEAEKAWRLLVLEDTGELLTPDAKTVIGQGLSRFLNVVDGLIGQGLRVLVLVTTNEEIRSLHPAVARPGRAAANVEFLPLSVEEAREWLDAHDVPDSAAEARTLAALYAQLEGRDPTEPPRAVGFAETA
jgi:hypothetical protein